MSPPNLALLVGLQLTRHYFISLISIRNINKTIHGPDDELVRMAALAGGTSVIVRSAAVVIIVGFISANRHQIGSSSAARRGHRNPCPVAMNKKEPSLATVDTAGASSITSAMEAATHYSRAL